MQAASLRERDAAIESVRNFLWRVVERYRRRFGGCAEDAYQECIALLCENWPQYDPTKSKFITWARFTCQRHLRRCYAMGRLDSPDVRVSIHAFERRERVYVISITTLDDGLGLDEPACEPEPEPPTKDDFVAFAKSLVGRSLNRDEQRVLVGRFVDDRTFETIAKRHRFKSVYRPNRVFQKFTAEVRQRHKTAPGLTI